MNWQYVRSVMESLGYDFQHFEVENFIHHLEQRRGRNILRVSYDFHPGLTGLWIPAETTDYIFYAQFTHPIHQIHIVLHEIAHMLLKHDTLRIDQLLTPTLIEIFHHLHDVEYPSSANFRDDSQEQEAEAFVYLIQQRIVAARRFDRLTQSITSIAGLDRFTDTLGWMG